MTNAQNIRTTIAQLMREKQEFKTALKKAEKQNSYSYEKVLAWEEAYITSGENEKVGQKLDEAYDEYSEANEAMHEAEQQVKAIDEALQALRKAVEAIEWLGL